MTDEAQPFDKPLDKRRRPERKVEILQAVMTLLEENSRKVTTAALAERVGLSEAALYRHFKSKEAIFHALVDYIEDHLIKPANQLIGSGDSPLLQLRRLFIYHLNFFAQHPGLCRLFLVEGISPEGEEVSRRMVAVIHKYTVQVKQILRQGQAAGELSAAVPVETAAQLFVGILQSRTLGFVLSRFKQLPNREADILWRFYWHAIVAEGWDERAEG